MTTILDELNPEQQQVVRATHGPVLVLAGAGSGKTRALTHRIAYLLHERIATPDEVMAVTFTNKAAAEMKHRIKNLLAGRYPLPTAIGTFHALGVRMLREQIRRQDQPSSLLSRSSQFTIYDTQDSERLIRQVVAETGMKRKDWTPHQIRQRISRAKNSLQSPEDLQNNAGSPFEEMVATVFARYEKLLHAQDAYDFDDLLLEPLRLLENAADIRASYQQRWRFLSVDEYQDTNPLQDRLLKLLLGPEKNICVVGDDYQAIYSWRGANVDHILHFESNFPGCTTIYLTQNYRSTPAILEAADCIIAENKVQKHKKLWTEVQTGSPVGVALLPSDQYEASWVRQRIVEHTAAGGRLSECAILYRTNAQSRLFEEQFLRHNLPYTIVGGWRFYERREVKDALAFLQLWVNPNSLFSIQRIAAALWRGVGDKTIARWNEEATQKEMSLESIIVREANVRRVVQAVATTYTRARERSFATVTDILRYLVTKSGYQQWIQIQPDGEERWRNVEELFTIASVYNDVATFLSEIALLSDIDTLDTHHDRITCMTLHASKGLEFARVFLVGCEEGLLPHSNSLMSQTQLEEERRLMYVGMTRAKQDLTVSAAMSRYVHGTRTPQAPSRFLRALPETVQLHDGSEEEQSATSTTDLIDFIPDFS